ncbi:hypothetical protein SAMN05660860_00139 [Geoalkalibacter ferrihydriticus]|uniref:Wadjet protein JetD C-terminal domain-containing protein n=2 Tax=Geoalkalibacter ferrihydriticus TaxID=392333 RepID=A0A0C2HTS2_9BACT|nr:Wadjet anti-phage system protein JetD domain-containing protein [Geoalkalibacter ferrihydriticus]KIH76247.1 hypothetical protein GFER_11545 [Geoalkalibacter ferrihydriticus DSM 17813]SDL24636.1 hypothetical protein SAMN05660860_00139 [Geoalkalibacter ferrihydriticus]
MNPGHDLLRKLFQIWQRNPDGKQRKTLTITKERAPAYFQTIDPDAKDQLHACLKNAAAEGCIELVWGKHFESHLLRKIILLDGETLGRFLGVPLAREIAAEAQAKLMFHVPPEESWLSDLVARVAEKWSRGEAAYRISPGEVGEVKLLIDALGAVKEGKQKGLDLRTFSARVLGDSKAMERMYDRFARIWNEQFDTGLEPKELFESLGLVKFPQPLFFKGPVRIKSGGDWLNMEPLKWGFGIPPDAIEDIAFALMPSYILTIENLASFNRHVREVDDEGLIVFSAGFLNPHTAEVIQTLERKLDSHTPFFHWGDIDVGGLRIANHLQAQIRRDLRLHLMSPEILSRHGEMVTGSLPRFRAKSISPQIQDLMDALVSHDPAIILEQESIDPQPPQIP